MDIRDIYGDTNIEGIRIETSITSPDKPLCVFGILETARGLFIEERMMEWLTPCYNVIRVYQQPSGKLFEYPALRLAQYLCTQAQNAPYCLYIHTKGAANWQTLQAAVISNWKTEFTSNKKNYISQMMTENPVVCCPFTGLEKQTWFNGFFANKAAWADLDTIKPNEDRFVFENLWRDYPNTKVYGIRENRVAGVIACRRVLREWALNPDKAKLSLSDTDLMLFLRKREIETATVKPAATPEKRKKKFRKLFTKS